MKTFKAWDGKSKEDWFYYLTNVLGHDNLFLCYNYFKGEDMYFSRWITYETVCMYHQTEIVKELLPYKMTRQQFIEKVTHRQILDIELLLDIDDCYHPRYTFPDIKTKAKCICIDLERKKIPYVVYWTGSKSYHISFINTELRQFDNYQRTMLKRKVLEMYGADTMKATPKCMISLELAKHYKSGQPKKKVKLI